MPVAGGPNITKTGILLEVDAANGSSYASGSSTWINVFRQGTNNGTINGNIGFDPNDSKGALTFPGTASTFVDFGNIGNLSVSWSFQVAVKPAPSASGNYTILSYASGSDTGSITYKLDYSSSNQSAVLSVFSTTGSARIVHQVTGSVSTGSWSIINASYGNSVVGMYVNGAPTDYVVTTGSTAGYNANNRLYLGGTFGVTSSFYTGSMASFFAYNSDVPNTQLVQNYNAYATRFGLRPSILFPSSVDPDAFRFIEVANITDPTQAAAVSNLVVGLKGAGLWDKMQAIYPLVGGTAYSHKFNLKDPTIHQLSFIGGVTHNSNGVKGNGTNGYAATSISTATAGPGDIHLSFYTNEASASFGSNARDVAVTAPLQLELLSRRNTDNAVVLIDPSGVNIARPTEIRSGYRVVSRTATNSTRYYKDGVFIESRSNSATGAVGSTLRIMTGASTGNVSVQAQQYTSFGLGLTDTDVLNLYTLVQAYQTTLGRQV